MKAVVIRSEGSENDGLFHDAPTSADDMDEAFEALETGQSNVVFVEGEKSSLDSLFKKLRRFPRKLCIVLLNPGAQYYILSDNSLNSSISFSIPFTSGDSSHRPSRHKAVNRH